MFTYACVMFTEKKCEGCRKMFKNLRHSDVNDVFVQCNKYFRMRARLMEEPTSIENMEARKKFEAELPLSPTLEELHTLLKERLEEEYEKRNIPLR